MAQWIVLMRDLTQNKCYNFSCDTFSSTNCLHAILKKMAFFSACYKNKKYYAYIGLKRIMISCQIAAKWHLLSIIIEFTPT